MVYNTKSELPETLRATLPDEAQTVYMEAYNRAMEGHLPTGGSDLSNESAAHAVAWNAVEREYERSDSDGKWYPIGEAPSEEETDSGIVDKIKNLF